MTDSNANLATVAEIYAAYNNGVTKPLMDALADDFEMHEHAPVTVPWGGIWKGPVGMENFLAEVTANMAHLEYVCEGMMGRDDIVTSWGRFRTRSTKSSQVVAGLWMHRVVFCDGKIIELHEFADSLSVAEAFGLARQTPLEPHEAEAAKRV
ncbi:MAG: nuclear transport factor 2 family protein [Alphaproteobacteria bacterium]|jgi:ketosteroid isomerase-like protein